MTFADQRPDKPQSLQTAGRNLMDWTTEFMCRARQTGINGPAPHFGERTDALRTFRRSLLRSEMQEYIDAEGDNDPVETLDGLLDIIVVAWGNAVAYFGEEAALEAAGEVAWSNLEKVIGTVNVEGKMVSLPIFREDGKVMKPPNWRGPRIAEVLGRHGYPTSTSTRCGSQPSDSSNSPTPGSPPEPHS